MSGLTSEGWVPGDHRSPGARAARRIGLILAFATFLAAAAACENPRSPAGADQPDRAALAALHQQPPIYPLVYAPDAVDPRIARAEERLTTACMAKHGFRYHSTSPAPAATAQDQDPAWEGPAPFGLETLEPPASTGPTPDEPKVPSSQRTRYARVLYGDPRQRVTVRGARVEVSRPANGCAAEAQRRLLGAGRVRWIQLRVLLYEAEQDARGQLDGDPEVRAANARWQQCMRDLDAGYKWADPMELFHAMPADVDIHTSPATRADLRCKNQTGYLAVAYTRLAAAQQRLLDKDPSVVADWKSLLRRQEAAARIVLGNP